MHRPTLSTVASSVLLWCGLWLPQAAHGFPLRSCSCEAGVRPPGLGLRVDHAAWACAGGSAGTCYATRLRRPARAARIQPPARRIARRDQGWPRRRSLYLRRRPRRRRLCRLASVNCSFGCSATAVRLGYAHAARASTAAHVWGCTGCVLRRARRSPALRADRLARHRPTV